MPNLNSWVQFLNLAISEYYESKVGKQALLMSCILVLWYLVVAVQWRW